MARMGCNATVIQVRVHLHVVILEVYTLVYSLLYLVYSIIVLTRDLYLVLYNNAELLPAQAHDI